MSFFKKSNTIFPNQLTPVQAFALGSLSSLASIPALYFLKMLGPLAPTLIFLISFFIFCTSFFNPLFQDNDNYNIRELAVGFWLVFTILSFVFIPGTFVKNGFSTVGDAATRASKLRNLNIKMENENPIKPVYDSYYRSLESDFFERRFHSILRTFKFLPQPLWSKYSFLESLNKINDLRNQQGHPAANFIHKVNLDTNSKIIVWGDLQGAFTSLARDLEHLKNLGVIDNEFKLTKPSDYIVFNGDAVSRSPMQLETLTLIFNVLLANPENAFYMKGNHETDNYWHGFGLKTELQLRLEEYWQSGQEMPFEQEMNQMFSNLPLALYFSVPGDPGNDFVRISHYGSMRNPLLAKEGENKFYKFLTQKDANLKAPFITFSDVREESSNEDVQLLAILKSEKKRDTYQDMDGLRMLSPEAGVTAWTLISCPTEVYQKGLKFFYDAFAIIQVNENVNDWKITLHKQDVRTLAGFEQKEYKFITGVKSDAQDQSVILPGFNQQPDNEKQVDAPIKSQPEKQQLSDNAITFKPAS